jgi:hypothetical protein
VGAATIFGLCPTAWSTGISWRGDVDLTALVAGAEERMGAGLGAPVDRGQGRRLRRGPQRRGGRTSMAVAPMADRRGRTGRRRRTAGRAPDPRGGGGRLGGTRRGGGLGAGRTGWLRTLGARWGGFATGGGLEEARRARELGWALRSQRRESRPERRQSHGRGEATVVLPAIFFLLFTFLGVEINLNIPSFTFQKLYRFPACACARSMGLTTPNLPPNASMGHRIIKSRVSESFSFFIIFSDF